MISRARRNCLWFGTKERAGWFQTPNSGADTSPIGYSSSGELLNGGGYVFDSRGSHKQYVFEWPKVAPEVAQKLKSYADGTYGRGLMYFHLPNTYGTNILPAAWADPSIGEPLVYGVEPVFFKREEDDGLPVYVTGYDLASVPSGFRGEEEALYIPIPEGYVLLLGGTWDGGGGSGVYRTNVNYEGEIGETLFPVHKSTSTFVVNAAGANLPDENLSDAFKLKGVYLWVGTSPAFGPAQHVSITSLVARLAKYEDLLTNLKPYSDPWVGGQGHSGCRFVGKPTYIEHHPGKVSFAATLKEVGMWAHG